MLFDYNFNVDYFVKTFEDNHVIILDRISHIKICEETHDKLYELMRIFQSCRNSMGRKFWKIITNKCDVKPTTGVHENDSDLQLQRYDVYVTSGVHGECAPISVMVELNCTTRDYDLNSILGKSFQPDYFIGGSSSGSNDCERKTMYSDIPKSVGAFGRLTNVCPCVIIIYIYIRINNNNTNNNKNIDENKNKNNKNNNKNINKKNNNKDKKNKKNNNRDKKNNNDKNEDNNKKLENNAIEPTSLPLMTRGRSKNDIKCFHCAAAATGIISFV